MSNGNYENHWPPPSYQPQGQFEGQLTSEQQLFFQQQQQLMYQQQLFQQQMYQQRFAMPLPQPVPIPQPLFQQTAHPSWQTMPPPAATLPMHIALPPSVYQECIPRKRSHESPVDESSRMRGRWTAEEEAYADVLMKHFRTGSLSDCEEGTLLRTYLADKLDCIPMRISKKFVGVNKIGREVYRPGQTKPEILMHLDYVRNLFIESSLVKKKRIKRKAAFAARKEKLRNAEKEMASLLCDEVQETENAGSEICSSTPPNEIAEDPVALA